MSQQTIGQRIKYLMDSQGWSIRKFARALDVADTNIRNYIDKGTKPGSDVLEKLLQLFPATNPGWLLTGNGEPFLSAGGGQSTHTGNTFLGPSNNVGINHGTNTVLNAAGHVPGPSDADCRAQLAQALADNQSLREQLQRADALVAAKDETIAFMRSAFRNPN